MGDPQAYWRIEAKHATVCPKCRGYISKGTDIVKDEDYSKWVHAVCPGGVPASRETAFNVEEYEESGTNEILHIGGDGTIVHEVVKEKK
jgi:hypothetical protein